MLTASTKPEGALNGYGVRRNRRRGALWGITPQRCLLARGGYRVLLVDKATFPSDTMSTHFVHPPGVAALGRWGILGRLEATNCPPVAKYSFDFGPVTISGTPRPANGTASAYAPRRIVARRAARRGQPLEPARSCARRSRSRKSWSKPGG